MTRYYKKVYNISRGDIAIYLREVTERDLDAINKYRNNKGLTDLLGGVLRFVNIETDQKWLQSYQGSRANNVRCAICLEDSDELIGVVYLLDIDWVSRTAEFAIFIGDEKHRGKGIGKETTIKMLQHGFSSMNLNRIHLKVLDYNERAIKLYERLGFKEEGIMRQAVYKNGEYRNLKLMSILKKEAENLLKDTK